MWTYHQILKHNLLSNYTSLIDRTWWTNSMVSPSPKSSAKLVWITPICLRWKVLNKNSHLGLPMFRVIFWSKRTKNWGRRFWYSKVSWEAVVRICRKVKVCKVHRCMLTRSPMQEAVSLWPKADRMYSGNRTISKRRRCKESGTSWREFVNVPRSTTILSWWRSRANIDISRHRLEQQVTRWQIDRNNKLSKT